MYDCKMGSAVSRQAKTSKPAVETVSAAVDPEPVAVPSQKPVNAELQELKETIADLREQTIVILETKAEALREEAKAIDEVKQSLIKEDVVAPAVVEPVTESKPEPAVVETVQVSSTGCCSAAIVITADAAPEPVSSPDSASSPPTESTPPSESNDAPQTPPSSLEETTVIKPDTSVL